MPMKDAGLMENYGFYAYTSEYMKDHKFQLRRTMCILFFGFVFSVCIYIFSFCVFFQFWLLSL